MQLLVLADNSFDTECGWMMGGEEEEDKERRQEELQALEAIYGDLFTLGEICLCHSTTRKSRLACSLLSLSLCVITNRCSITQLQL